MCPGPSGRAGPCPAGAAAFWDFGHILDPAERESLQRTIASREAAQEKQWLALVDRARRHLQEAGISEDAVTCTFTRNEGGAAESILQEAQRGGIDTIIMGRRGLGLARTLLGSVSARVVQEARNRAVTIAE